MMKFLITGITGFAGPHLTNLLIKEGHKVCGLVRCTNGRENDIRDVVLPEIFDQITFHHADLKDLHSVQTVIGEVQFDGIFHLAAQSYPPISFTDPINTFADNVMGSVNLITCVHKYQERCKFMFCSTCQVYGDSCKKVGVLKEEMPLAPSDPYGVSKAAIDLYIQERIKNNFIRGFVARAFSHTGPRRGCKFSIASDASQIAKMMLGLQDKVLLVGNLETQRAVMDVRDCVRAYYLLMIGNKLSENVYNICSSDVHKMSYFADLLVEMSGLGDVEKKIHPPFYRPIDIQIQIGDTTRLVTDTGWKPKITMEQTLNDLLDYWVKKLS